MPSNKSNSNEIKTTGQLRECLAAVIINVRCGALPVDRASVIVKSARGITDSLYSEVKVKTMTVELGAKPTATVGDLEIGDWSRD